jgi:KDO2-lipid IV(A) lauroyltransferase
LGNGVEKPKAPLGYRVSRRTVSICPTRALFWAAYAGGFVHYWLCPVKRRQHKANTSRACRPAGPRPPWRAFQHHALNVLELLRATTGSSESFTTRTTLQGAEHIDRALARGRGLILATFHSGNWELAGMMLASRGYPITTIAGEQLRPGWSEQVKALKESYGIRMTTRGAAMRSLYHDIRSNRAIVLHIDGDLFEGGQDVSFLGRIVKAPRGPARLSRTLGCPVAFAYCRRTAWNRLRVVVEPFAEPPTDSEGEAALTQTLVSRMEKCVLEDPGQWCIFRELASSP